MALRLTTHRHLRPLGGLVCLSFLALSSCVEEKEPQRAVTRARSLGPRSVTAPSKLALSAEQALEATRAELEKNLLSLQVLTPRDVTEADTIMRAIAAHEPFDAPGARIEADERWLAQRLGQTDQRRKRVETQLWEARGR